MKGQDRQKRAHYFVKQLGLLRYQRRCNWFCVDLSSKIDANFLISAKPSGRMTNIKSTSADNRERSSDRPGAAPVFAACHFLFLCNFKGHLAASLL